VRPRICAMISCYQEGDLLWSTIESASMLDEIFVVEGSTEFPLNSSHFHGEARKTPTEKRVRYMYYEGVFKSDADKRSAILREAQAWNHDAWGIWIDGDEILLFGDYLRDHCSRADEETATGGATIRLVEYDGSVANCYGKLIKLGSIRNYVMSSYEVTLESGMTVALPNVPICSAGGIPLTDSTDRNDPDFAVKRPPVIGEPHLLHRHGLRSPRREAPRLHDKEAESFEQLVKERK